MEDDDTYSLEKALSSLTDSPAEKESNPEEKDSHNHDSKSGIVETAQIKSSKINGLREPQALGTNHHLVLTIRQLQGKLLQIVEMLSLHLIAS